MSQLYQQYFCWLTSMLVGCFPTNVQRLVENQPLPVSDCLMYECVSDVEDHRSQVSCMQLPLTWSASLSYLKFMGHMQAGWVWGWWARYWVISWGAVPSWHQPSHCQEDVHTQPSAEQQMVHQGMHPIEPRLTSPQTNGKTRVTGRSQLCSAQLCIECKTKKITPVLLM